MKSLGSGALPWRLVVKPTYLPGQTFPSFSEINLLLFVGGKNGHSKLSNLASHIRM